MWLSNIFWFETHHGLQVTLNQLGGLLITIGGLAILWDLRGKRDLMHEVLEKTRLSSDISSAGLDRVSMDWMDVPWDELFRDANHVSVFISYGSSWRKVHWPKLQDLAQRQGKSLRLFLPDPDDDLTMRLLAKRYSYTPERMRAYVIEAAQEFAALAQSSQADIRIYYRAGDPTYTCYHFDDKVLVTLYANKRERGAVPTMLIGRGKFRDFFKEDLVAIEKQSTEVALASLLGGEK